jgi:NitT/TauT family transport system substrate-binding protein
MSAVKSMVPAIYGIAVAGLVALAAGPASAADEAHTLSVRLDWLPSGYQAPVFLAQDKGWYKKAGLDVTIVQGNGSATTVQLVATGQFDVGIAALSNMAFARSKGMPVTSLAGFFRKGDVALIVPVDSPIKSPSDFKGKRLVYTPGSFEAPFLDSLFAKGGLTRSQVDLLGVDASAKTPTYLTGTVDGVFSSTAYTLALVAAKRPGRAVLFADSGLNLPGIGIIVTEAALKKKADALRSFSSISAGAWAYVLSGHEEEAVQAMLKTHEQDRLDPFVVRTQLKDSLPFLTTPATAAQPMGVQAESDWADAIGTMEKAKAIEAGSKAKDYFTNDYLDPAVIKSFGAGG